MDKFGISDYDCYWENRLNEAHYQFTDVHRKIIEEAREILGNRRSLVLDCGVGPDHTSSGRALGRRGDSGGGPCDEFPCHGAKHQV
jgi:hypothetical protein